MAFGKYKPSGDDVNMTPLVFSKRVLEKANCLKRQKMSTGFPTKADVDLDLREVYFLIMHFLSAGPCKRTCDQLWNELLEHKLLPRRYHAWYSRSGAPSGDEDDDGTSLPLCYLMLTERYPHIEKDHLIKLLKQLILSYPSESPGILAGGPPTAADVPTLLGSGSFSLLGFDRELENKGSSKLPAYLRWPHMQADQVRGLSLREIGGGFTKHHRAPSVRAACYAIAKPSTLVKKMEFIKKLRGHQNAVYCATFDRSGRYVITGSDDRLVKIWSMETAFCLSSCRGHEGDITDLAVSINNALVASSSNDFIIRVWRLPDGVPISVLRGHIGAVTAIAFSPRQGAAYQLLSSSDDGTCRIWDARNSNVKPRIYVPKPPDVASGRITDPSSSSVQQNNQILCCAFNANGTVFVTGSSDTFARVWNACKGNSEDLDQPNNEMDLLSGHENDVNYVQFSGCAVASRSSVIDSSKEDNLPKFKNSWFTHDNIVTCSRDGSAIIWIPRSRRSHGKVGRWTRAYHLKVPPPPMPPQPAHGGPRQRYQPTPRGVNMIVWSLDNRFVLAAIMDCRICVWNASDGSLVHSLMGHKESTFVLDVHPFNPRIAMSAGYDGKTIIWDIWEGKPVQIYETGPFKLVDGKFSPDGTSIVLSDEVGQVYIVTTGQGESQKDAKYDQFFLGDYRPLMQDTHGNTIDQETQLLAHRRNVQDLLCDSSMIPYPEPYQSMYQRRRLGILGVEWRPTSLKLAVGPTYNASTGDYQPLPVVDLEQWIEPLPEIVDVIDWEQENDIQTDDNDSEYNVTEEYLSEEEQESLSNSSYGEGEHTGEDGTAELESVERLRRSRRKKPKFDVEITTSSGRRVKRRNLDERDGMAVSRSHKSRRSKHGGSKKRSKTSESKSLRPQRVAARNARSLFEKITGVSTDGEDYDEEPDSSFSESDSTLVDLKTSRVNSKRSTEINQVKHETANVSSRLEQKDVPETSQVVQGQVNALGKRRLVFKFPRWNHNIFSSSENLSLVQNKNEVLIDSVSAAIDHQESSKAARFTEEAMNETGGRKHSDVYYPKMPAEYQDNGIKWGEVKLRSSKRLKLGEMVVNACPMNDAHSNITGTVGSDTDECQKSLHEQGICSNSKTQIPDSGYNGNIHRKNELDSARQGLNDTRIQLLSPEGMFSDRNTNELVKAAATEYYQYSVNSRSTADVPQAGYELVRDSQNKTPVRKHIDHETDQVQENAKVGLKIRIKSVGITSEVNTSPANFKSSAREGCAEREIAFGGGGAINEQSLSADPHEEDEKTSGPGILEAGMSRNTGSSMARDPETDVESNGKMYSAVYKRSKSSKSHKNLVDERNVKEPGESNFHDHDEEIRADPINGSPHRTRLLGCRASIDESYPSRNSSGLEQSYCSMGTSRSKGKSILDSYDELVCDGWRSAIKSTVGLRSSRNRRENYSIKNLSLGKRKDSQALRKYSWLMLLKQEEGCRYIPQKGDEIAYLRQGHEEYISSFAVHETGPWKSMKGLKTVELCKVHTLDYSTLPGSGESCCKLTLEFIDPSSIVFGKAFKFTLPELVSFPDFLVERTRFEASIDRNWTRRDKCQVWWRNSDGNGGSWWEGRIVSVSPKSPEFPDSPWERYTVQYRNETSESHLHSPWELHDVDSQCEHPHIDEQIRDKLLASICDLEDSSLKNKDYYGVQKLNQISQKSGYLNRYPVPLSLEVIKMRLENNYYRTLEAVEHDASVMLSNAKSYFGKSSEMAKMRRVSTWLTNLFLEL